MRAKIERDLKRRKLVAKYDKKRMALKKILSDKTISSEMRMIAQEALEKLLINRTAVIIAHRLSTIRDVDRIFVLKQGRIIESGNHQQLLDKKGLYHSLYQLQMMGHKESIGN